MGKGGTLKTKHHCPGKSGWVGEESPGGCDEIKRGGLIYCTKHQMPCRQGCKNKHHLKNQAGCLECEGRWLAEARMDRRAKENHKKIENGKGDETFWNSGLDRKRQKK
jgi:hypothetical protein